ncbi:MAG: DNA adenine methylase [Caulobacter sp.]|nr:DNA adenine methylase [Caulobacter sp.]
MKSNSFVEVAPTRPIAPYIGGKRNLATRLVKMIETIPHATYAEVFVGMGGIFLRRRSRPPAEVINDWSRDVWTFYRVLQEHYAFFLQMLRFQITSRSSFERLMAVDPETLTDLQRAARFLYLQRVAFGGKVAGRNFGVAPGREGRFNVNRLEAMLEDLHERLAGVTIERLRWQDFIRRYDRPDTLFYLDPPYYGCEGDYGPDMFARGEFEEMAAMLRQIRGRFILSLNDRPQVREIFAGFTIAEEATTYGLPSAGAVKAAELVITNFVGGGRSGTKK